MFNQFSFGPQSIPNANGPMLASKPGMFSGILSKLNPFPEGLAPEAANARAEALMMAGFGMLAGNQGNYGAALPAIAQGGMQGLQAYRNALKEQAARRQAMLQEKLINSQIGENDAQTLERKRKTELAQKLERDRQSLVKTLDEEFGPMKQTNTIGADGGVNPDGSIGAPTVNVGAQPYWGDTVEGNREASRRAQLMGNQELAMEYWKRSQDLVDVDLKREQINKERRPDQKITIGSPSGGNEQWDYIFDPTGKAPGQRLAQDPRYVFAGKRQAVANTTISNIPAKAEEAYSKTFGEKVAGNDSVLYETAQKAPEMAQTANMVKKILKEGKPITGFGANFRLGFASAAQQMGIQDESVADSQSLGQMLARTTMDAIKSSGLGAGQGFTNTDREFLEKAAAGQITFDEKTLTRAADLNYKAALRARDKWKSRYKMMPRSAKEATGITDEIDIPPQYEWSEKPKAKPPTPKTESPRVLRFDSKGNLIK